MNKVLQIQKIVFNCLKLNAYISQNNIPIVNHIDNTFNGTKYPFVRILSISKIPSDDFNDEITVSVSVISNKNSSIEAITVSNYIEQDFNDKTLLERPYIYSENQGLDILPSIISHKVIKTDIYQDQEFLFNAQHLINFFC